jgi:hypothetical protein
VSRKRRGELRVRVPNPRAPAKERLRTPAHQVHRSKKGYRRRAKHARPPDEDAGRGPARAHWAGARGRGLVAVVDTGLGRGGGAGHAAQHHAT